jgi:hypothetical protein
MADTTDSVSVDEVMKAFLAVSKAINQLKQEEKSRVLNAAGALHGLFPVESLK